MADPLFGTSLIDELRRDERHTMDIATVLQELTRRLDEEGIPFAIIGALAMRHHGYVRHTEDIDILTTPEGLDRIHERLVGRGYVPRAPGLRKKLRESEHRVNIDVIQAGEHAGSKESSLVFPDPRSDRFVVFKGQRVPDLALLIEFKLTSGIYGNRPQDLGDVFQLIKANRLRKPFVRKLPQELRAKFLELLENVRHEKEV
ncbi:MAG: hypothetical protein HYZ53_15690 [Planctomycetes bacterium]|nr:hypothetical protein [Planctomycetota bacterium]